MSRNVHSPQSAADLPLFAPRPEQQRDRILAAVAESAGTKFLRAAETFVLEELRRRGRASGEALVDAAKAAGIVPLDDRAFGPVFRRLSQTGQIVKVGYAPRARGHATAGGLVWALAEVAR